MVKSLLFINITKKQDSYSTWYSEKRGKVYLPFLDEDPVTAQILSKVIMLAEDTKIKNPAILKQIITHN